MSGIGSKSTGSGPCPLRNIARELAKARRNDGWRREITIDPDRAVHTRHDDRPPGYPESAPATSLSGLPLSETTVRLHRVREGATRPRHLAVLQALVAIVRSLVEERWSCL